MRHVLLRDSEGQAHRLAHVADAPRGADELEPLAEWETRRLTGELHDEELVRLWQELAAAGGSAGEPPADAELRGWAEEELVGPTARLRLWREPRTLVATTMRRDDDVGPAARAIDLASLAPRRHWVEVRLVDPDGQPLSGVSVTLWKPDGGRERATTDADGVARWSSLPDGDARVLFDDTDVAWRETR